ncbi:5-methyltetrahydropteroyltriglutamate--homocysteine S-methyltransferase [Peptoniphilus sp. AGMB00490]|uniref:5-methyltetrahydropteroyltriglutamate--homocysteine S-methyltransferase n=1 Tax=Peptoniphilus faecalis TaxID=2731255 RepID=A0A848RN24_9FIRM|nr:5-methyltetrahydropteroyltriglutamate--homocysteine S-methyltransferase [Peptoniphilus faecalis]NMW85682.1 5-methyltetrahydropteroyltriglutamate--homocysteine S-methyltransferase [Peptoniphilus faecalis]
MTKILAPSKYDVVGSFLRPVELKIAREKFKKGEIDSKELKEVEDREIEKLVKKEKEAGLKIISDGEFRRSWWHYDFFWGLEGIEKYILKEDELIHFHGETLRPEGVKIVGKIGGKNHPFLEHYKFIKKFEDENTVAKQTIPSPAQLLRTVYKQIGSGEVYQDENKFIEDVAGAYGEFFHEIYELGCRNLQIDDCTWGALVDEDATKIYESDGKNIEDLKKIYLEINNRAIEKAPDGLNITTHICKGNYKSSYHFKGAYDAVADYVFAKEKVSAFYLEYDDERSGDFKALSKIPEGKKVVLGIITSKRPELEDKEKLKERIKEASQYISLENICISPQCGFSSTEEGNTLTEEDQWKKIALLKEVAEEVLE